MVFFYKAAYNTDIGNEIINNRNNTMKKIVVIVAVAVVLLTCILYFFNKKTPEQIQEQAVLEQTVAISKEYLSLRLQTDNVLISAENYPDYEAWNTEMTKIIADWNGLEKKSQELENSAQKTAELSATNFNLIQTAQAYSAKEISNIYDKAPKFKGIATLAKHLGVDAKKAQVILNQAQAEISSDIFTEEGNAFETLENTAIVVKDSCKVVGFVGGAVITGGATGLATTGTMAQIGTVIVGTDLALEVTEDGAQIALGDRNKVSSFVKNVRTVTEPIAAIITITDVPGNLGNTYGNFDSVMLGLEQFRESAQEGKVIGVDLTNFEYHKPFERIRKAKYPETVSATEMEMSEVENWLQSLNKKLEPMTPEEIKDFLAATETKEVKEVAKEETKTNETETKKETTENRTGDIPNQIIKVKNVSGSSWMMDTCFSPTCWDNLAAKPEEDRDLGGIYTQGKVFANGEGFDKEFKVSQSSDSSALVKTSDNSYKITLYFALAPFEGPKNKTIDYGTWISKSIEIKANFGDEPVIEWDGSDLKQVK